MKSLHFTLPLLLIGASALLAQSGKGAGEITHQAQYRSAARVTPDIHPPAMESYLTIVGANVTGLPCQGCVSGASTPNLGIFGPDIVFASGDTMEITSLLVDYNFDGPCTYTWSLTSGPRSKLLAQTSTTQSESANTDILLGATLTVPMISKPAQGYVTMTNTCGGASTRAYVILNP